MPTHTLTPTYHTSIEFIREEIRALLENGTICRPEPIYTLANYVPPREWLEVERQLEDKDYLLRDRICDLLTEERWDND